MSFFSGLDFFILLALILIPAIVLGISEVNLRYYRIIASIAILFLIFRDDLRSVVFLIIFVTLEFLLIRVYLRIREAAREAVVYRLFLFFSILPLIFSKLSEITELSLFLSLIHISEPTRQAEISYAVFCLKKKKQKKTKNRYKARKKTK